MQGPRKREPCGRPGYPVDAEGNGPQRGPSHRDSSSCAGPRARSAFRSSSVLGWASRSRTNRPTKRPETTRMLEIRKNTSFTDSLPSRPRPRHGFLDRRMPGLRWDVAGIRDRSDPGARGAGELPQRPTRRASTQPEVLVGFWRTMVSRFCSGRVSIVFGFHFRDAHKFIY